MVSEQYIDSKMHGATIKDKKCNFLNTRSKVVITVASSLTF